MKLNEAQIEELYAFTRKKYVDYYDVQSELVDHLATAIEEKMSQSKNISFENALQQVYTGFGIFGFSELVTQKETEAAIKGRNLFRKSFFEYFKLPKILLFAMIFIVIYKIFEIASNEFILFSFYAAICVFNAIFIIKIIKLKRSLKKPLLQLKNIYFLSSSFGSSLIFVQLFVNSSISQTNGQFHAIIPLIFTIISIGYLAEIDVLEKLFNQQKRLYPEAFK
jgi:hypothetical protein